MVRTHYKYKWTTDRVKISALKCYDKALCMEYKSLEDFYKEEFNYMGPNWELAIKKYPLSPFVFKDDLHRGRINLMLAKRSAGDQSWLDDYKDYLGTDARGTQHSGTCCERDEEYDHPPFLNDIYKTSL